MLSEVLTGNKKGEKFKCLKKKKMMKTNEEMNENINSENELQ
jgi:hypothetical protein